jgi:hypothetical protein
MSVENTIEALYQYCKNSSGDPQIWKGKSATYYWNRGKTTMNGTVNGVVRKLASANPEIWVVAGSLKIAADGTILRFTGIPKKDQKTLQGVGNITAAITSAKVLETV